MVRGHFVKVVNISLSSSGSTRRLQRINSQEELDFHETSSGSDQSELSGEDAIGELGWTLRQERTFERLVKEVIEKFSIELLRMEKP